MNSVLYQDRKWIALYQSLGNDFRRLSSWLDNLGIKRTHKDITGRDVPMLYARREYEKIIQHNLDDLEPSGRFKVRIYTRKSKSIKVSLR